MSNWFERLVDGGRRNWAPRSAAAVISDLSAAWAMTGSTLGDYQAAYQIDLTGETGTINGGGALPITAEQALAGTWNVLMGAQRDLQQTYQVRTAVAQDFAAAWDLPSSVFQSLSPVWQMAGSTSRDIAPAWQVSGAAQQDRSAEWSIVSLVTGDYSAEYVIETTPLTAANSFSADYGIVAAVDSDGLASYDILAAVSPAELSAEWHVLLPVEQDIDAIYQVDELPVADLVAAWAVEGALATSVLVLRPIGAGLEMRPYRNTLELEPA